MKHQLIAAIDDTPTQHGQCALWWLGQHSFVIKLGASVIWIDPFLSPLSGRLVPPACPPEAATNADLVLGTHDHIDHIDRAVWPALAAAAPQARFVVPAPVRADVASATGLPPARLSGAAFGDALQFGPITVRPIPAAHERLDRDPASGLYPYLGYIIEGHGFRLYHSGDSCVYEGQRQLLRALPCDLLLLPINGRDGGRLRRGCIGNMTWQEAADLAGDLAPATVIPAHYEMFTGNTAPVDEFVAYMGVKYPGQRVVTPRHGATVIISAAPAALDR